MHPPRILGILAAIAVLATGCTPSPGPTPVPVTPVPTCTPEFGGIPVACTPADHERMQQLDQRYAEAERVFRESLQLEEDALRERLTTVSPEAEALYDPNGEYLVHMRKVAAAVGSEGLKSFEGHYVITKISRRQLDAADAPATLSITACVDSRGTVATYADGMTETGSLRPKLVLFTETAGPRIWDSFVGKPEDCS